MSKPPKTIAETVAFARALLPTLPPGGCLPIPLPVTPGKRRSAYVRVAEVARETIGPGRYRMSTAEQGVIIYRQADAR